MARYGELSLSNVLGFYLKRIRFLDCGYRCEGSPQCRRQYFMSECNPLVFQDQSEVEGLVDIAIKYCRGDKSPRDS